MWLRLNYLQSCFIWFHKATISFFLDGNPYVLHHLITAVSVTPYFAATATKLEVAISCNSTSLLGRSVLRFFFFAHALHSPDELLSAIEASHSMQCRSFL